MARSTTGTVTAGIYLQVKPEWGGNRFDGERPVWAARIVKATQNRPTKLDPDCVLVKINVELPKAAFYPLEPTATVVIPAGLVETPLVHVAPEDPGHECVFIGRPSLCGVCGEPNPAVAEVDSAR